MFGLSRLLQLASKITWRLTHGKGRYGTTLRRKPIRRSRMVVEELEGRIVPTLLGQQLFPSDNPWNQNISNAPVAASSATIIANIGASVHLHPDWGAADPANGSSPLYGIPVNIVHGNSTAKVNVIIDNYPGESDVGPVPIPKNAVLEGDFQNGPNPNGGGYNANQRGDSHLIVWDEDNNVAYELYGVSRPNDPTLFPNTNGVELAKTDTSWHAAQETVWNMKTDTFRTLGATSADAAGLSILAGLARPDEGLTVAEGGQGAIDHALRVTLPSSDVNPQYVYPASHVVSETQASDKLPFGGRLRLANTAAVNAIIASMPPESQIVAHAMQQYGLIVADIGSAMYITGSSAITNSPNTSLTWNLNDVFASNGLKALTAGDFLVVDLTPRVTGLSASSGPAGSTITITGQNFLGAAGRLSVLFGSTAATSVTVVDDGHVTAVVPNGAGTVDVRVQSGVNQTDTISSNPNANVTQPIFGYGISAITTADKFTYGSSTGATLTALSVTPGNPSVGAGNTATFTATGTFSDGSMVNVSNSVVWSSSNTGVATVNASGLATTLAAGATTITATSNGVLGSTTLTVTAAPPTFPTPTKLVATTGTGQITLTWNSTAGALMYDVYRGPRSGQEALLAAASGPTYTNTGLTPGTTYFYTVKAVYNPNNTLSGPSNEVSATVAGSVGTAPTIASQPSSVTAKAGHAANFTIVANGTGPLTYQWKKLISGVWVNVSSSNTSSFTGATSAKLTITSTAAGDAGTYEVVVTNAAGSVTSKGVKLTLTTAPKVTHNPSSQTVAAGATVMLTASASGSPQPTVQWQVRVGVGSYVNIPGGTGTTYSFTVAAGQNGYRYRAVFSNSAGSADTMAAVLTISGSHTDVTKLVTVTSPSLQVLGDGLFLDTFTITNTSSQSILGPIRLSFPHLPAGVSVLATTSIEALAPGHDARITLEFQDTSGFDLNTLLSKVVVNVLAG